MSIDGSSIRLKFDSVGGGLTARDGKALDWFTIAGEDKKFVPATAKIDGDSIVVSSSRRGQTGGRAVCLEPDCRAEPRERRGAAGVGVSHGSVVRGSCRPTRANDRLR